MILLLGGTSESAPLAEALAGKGYSLLVSTATDAPLMLPAHKNIERRSGPFSVQSLCELIEARGIAAVVDATHPYAQEIKPIARESARLKEIAYFRYTRSGSAGSEVDVIWAAGHNEAARMAAEFKRPILLTTGSRNLEPYAREAERHAVPLCVRVLPEPQSLDACKKAGIAEANIFAARGPFSVQANQALLRQRRIGVLVTKDSGAAGGVPEKLEAARLEKCAVIVLRRPPEGNVETFASVEALLAALDSIK